MVTKKVVTNQKRSTTEKGETSRRAKRKTAHEPAEDIPVPAPPLNTEQERRCWALTNDRTLAPSRWIDVATINELGLGNSVEFLTSRINLWDFLTDIVPTYRGITLEFLSSVEFCRATNVIKFSLGGSYFERTTYEIMQLLHLPHENSMSMNDTCTYDPDMPGYMFKNAICHTGVLTHQQNRAILHPALRYIQRVLAHSLFGRGHTISKFFKPEIFFLYCMMRRSANEIHLMPHFGYYLCKHLYTVATEHRPNGIITVGGIITKIARALHINVPDDVVGGPTTLNLDGLTQMRLIIRATANSPWLSTGLGNNHYQLPLEEDIDPTKRSTWKLDNVPTVELPLSGGPQLHADHGPAESPTNQQILHFMQQQFTTLNLRLDDMQTQLSNAEEDAYFARWYSTQTFENNDQGVEERDDPPTPPRTRRARQAAAAAQATHQQHGAAEPPIDPPPEQ
jgi:hypothetical protein